jgi:excisionase family DNA binding protein
VINQHARGVVTQSTGIRGGVRHLRRSNRDEAAPAVAEKPRPHAAPISDRRDTGLLSTFGEGLMLELAERVVDAVRDHVRMHPEPEWPRWLTTKTVARYIDRSERGIRGLIQRGAIPFVKQGGTLYFDRFVIDRWMAA